MNIPLMNTPFEILFEKYRNNVFNRAFSNQHKADLTLRDMFTKGLISKEDYRDLRIEQSHYELFEIDREKYGEFLKTIKEKYVNKEA